LSYPALSVLELGLLLALALSVALGVGANLLYRSVVLRREIATRRVLGARRRDIVRMFLLEGAAPIAIGLIAGSILAAILAWLLGASLSSSSVLIGAVAIACCGAAGGWIAARYASTISLRESGLYRGAPDKRGDA
jgi:ABC-type antimicrobial peptide transport system permease subunit